MLNATSDEWRLVTGGGNSSSESLLEAVINIVVAQLHSDLGIERSFQQQSTDGAKASSSRVRFSIATALRGRDRLPPISSLFIHHHSRIAFALSGTVARSITHIKEVTLHALSFPHCTALSRSYGMRPSLGPPGSPTRRIVPFSPGPLAPFSNIPTQLLRCPSARVYELSF